MVETGITEDPVWFPVPVVACRVVHGQEGQELAECRLRLISIYILDDDGLPHDLVSEGREESVHRMSGDHESFQLSLLVLEAVDVFLLGVPAGVLLLHLLHL